MKHNQLIAVATIAIAIVVSANAPAYAQDDQNNKKVQFAYDAGFEAVSAYLWRGQYNGGLSFQPDLEIGYDGENTSLRIGAWGSVGASDWEFQQWDCNDCSMADGGNPSTYFVPEVDITGMFTFYGVQIGFTHYYYFGRSKFLCWQPLEKWQNDDYYSAINTSTTEVTLGYDFSELDLCGLYFTWNTMVAGNDFRYNDAGGIEKRNFSSYLEIGYNHEFERIGMTLGGFVGMSPWQSDFYGNDRFAVTALSLRLDKEWEFDACSIDLFAQGMMNPYGLAQDPESAYIHDSGDNKICCQTLNGTIGLGVWF